MKNGDEIERLRARLEQTEEDLAERGYQTHRQVTHPGSRLSDQVFDQDSLLLVVFGQLGLQSKERSVLLRPGDSVEVPAGVPYVLEVVGDGVVYWILGRRTVEPTSQSPGDEE